MVLPNNIDLSQLDGLSEKEKEYALQILKELSSKGVSEKFNNLLYSDYEEIPVDIETFLHDSKYLGKGLVNEEGKFTVFPYWVDVLKKVFPDPLKPAAYNTLALSGAIGLGKSFVAVLCGLYELYRMLCLKDPYLHYGLQPIDKITFAFMNITLDASKGVAWDKCQQLLQSSPWFMEKGTVSGTTNVVWNPPKGIELIAGSLSRHIIGRAVYWCLDGDTEIATSLGDYKLSDLVDKKIQVYNIDESGLSKLSDVCTVKPTAIETEEYQIELEDGTIIKCTPTHRFMLSDGSYKEAQYLTEEDEIFSQKPFGYIYKFTNIKTGKIYIGKREKLKFDESYYGYGKLWLESFDDKKDIIREVLCWGVSREDLNKKEKYFIKLFNSQNPQIGYNVHKGGQGGNSLNNIDAWSQLHQGKKNGMYDKHHSDITKQKISKANKGRKYSNEINKTKGRPGVLKPNGFGEKIRQANLGKSISEETKQKISNSLKGKSNGCIYNNGKNEKRIKVGEDIPDDYVKGRLIKGKLTGKKNVLGKKWYNNGVNEILIDSSPPNDYVRGRIKRCKNEN